MNNLEAASAAKVVGFFNSAASENWTAVDYDVATNETETEDGGTGGCRVALYHADLAAGGWIGRPTTHTVQFGSAQAWLTMAFAEAPPPIDAFAQGWVSAWGGAVGSVVTPGSGGGARMGGNAIRKPPRS